MAWFTSPAAWKAIGKGVVSKGWGGTKAVGRVGRKAAVLGTAGAVGMGVNPFLGAGLGKLLGGMGGGGKGSLGAGGGLAGAASGAVGPGAGRDSSIVRGMTPLPEYKGPTFSKLSKSADFRTALQFTADVGRANYQVNIANNKGIVRIQQMLQGPTAARAKELRMESGKALAPVIINQNYFGEGEGKRGAGLGALLPFAALAGLLAGAGAAAAGAGAGTPAGPPPPEFWYQGPQNKYPSRGATGKDVGKYWKNQQAKATTKGSFKNTKFDPRRWPGRVWKALTVLVDNKPVVKTVVPEVVVQEVLEPLKQPQKRFTGKITGLTYQEDMGTGRRAPPWEGAGQKALPKSDTIIKGGGATVKSTGINKLTAPGVDLAGRPIISPPYEGAGQKTIGTGSNVVKITTGKIAYPRLILDWAPGGLEANWSGGKSISTTSKASTGTTATGARIANMPPGEGLSGRIPYKGARGSFYEGRIYQGQGFTQGKTMLGRRALTASEVAALRNAGLRVSAPAADGVRIIHEFDEGRWKTASKVTIESVIGKQTAKLLGGPGIQLENAGMSNTRLSFDTTHQTRIPTAKTIPGGGVAPEVTRIGTMPPGEGLSGKASTAGRAGSTSRMGGGITADEFIRMSNFRSSLGWTGTLKPPPGATARMVRIATAALKKVMGSGWSMAVFNTALYAVFVGINAYDCWYRKPDDPKKITKEQFMDRTGALTFGFMAAVISVELITVILGMLGVTTGWVVIPVAAVAAVIGMIAHRSFELAQQKRKEEGKKYSSIGDIGWSIGTASKQVWGMIKGLVATAIDKMQKKYNYAARVLQYHKDKRASMLETGGYMTKIMRRNLANDPEGLAAFEASLVGGVSPMYQKDGMAAIYGSGGNKFSGEVSTKSSTTITPSAAANTSDLFGWNIRALWDRFSGGLGSKQPKKSGTMNMLYDATGENNYWSKGGPPKNPEQFYTKALRWFERELKKHPGWEHIAPLGAAQAAKESGYGTSRYAWEGGNWFGMRESSRSTQTFQGDDKKPWSKFNSWDASARDWIALIVTKGNRYGAIKGMDVTDGAQVLQDKGYASGSTTYAQTLRDIMGSVGTRLTNDQLPFQGIRSGLSRRTESKRDSSKAITIPGHWRHSTQGRRTVKEWVPEVTIPPSALNLPGGGGGQVIINNITNSSDAGTQQFALTIDANEYNQFGGPLAPLSGQGDYDTSLGFA